MEDLVQRGFTITPDHHVRLQILMSTFSVTDFNKLEDLKFTLCPLFAKNETQQDIFYSTFDQIFSAFKPKKSVPASKAPRKEELPDIPKAKQWPYWLTFILLLCMAIFLAKQYMPVKIEQADIREEIIDTTQPPIEQPDIQDVDPSLPQQPDSIETKKPDDPEKKPSVDWHILRYALLIALALGLLLSELYRYNHRKMVLKKQKKKKPPLTWPIKVPYQKTAYLSSAQFYTIARRFRNRLFSDILRLNIPSTIEKSLASGGFPIPQYSEMTCQPEYLFLIHLPDFRNHYSGYAAQIADSLSDENIFVRRYFYMDSPQICFETIQDRRLLLDDLFRKYPDHRLIVVGTGDNFLHPLTGKVEPWIETFHQWHSRAVLTPRPITEWGMNEIILKSHFPLFPCTMNGMNHLSLFFDMHEKTSQQPFESPPQPLILPEEVDAHQLETIADDPFLFQWICACAVYPELHWNLTVYVGTKIKKKPVTEEQVLRLLQLPWFQTAEIPDLWRTALLQQLTDANKETTHDVIVDLLEKNPPPEQSAAIDLYRLNLSIHKWMLKPKDRERRKHVQKTVIDESRLAKDHPILRVLDAAPKSPLDLILPAKLRKLFFRHALPLFGLKSGIRLLLSICMSLFLVLLAVMPDLPELLQWDESEPPIFVLQKNTIEQGDDVTLMAANASARQKDQLQIKWDQTALPPILPDGSDNFLWTFKPFDTGLPSQLLNPGYHQIIAGFTESAWSEPLTIQIRQRAPPEPEPKTQTTAVIPSKTIEKGRLYITAIPETARIEIKHIKKSYNWGMALNSGRYVISLSQAMYVTQTKQILIQAGQDTRETITLEAFGKLTVKPMPDDSRIRIMNIKPKYQDAMALAPGRYHIEVSKNGFKTYEKWITLDSGEDKVVSVDLSARPAQLTVNVVPKDAGIQFKNHKKTYTKGMSLRPGQYVILITKKDFESESRSITLAAGESKVLDVRLKKIYQENEKLTKKDQKKIKVWTEPVTGMEFVWLQKGCFMMGQTDAEKEQLIKDIGKSDYESYYKNELPRHKVCVDGFWMGRYEVTVEQYMVFAESNPKHMPEWLETGSEYHVEQGSNNHYKTLGESLQAKKNPIVGVSWNNAKAMSKWISAKTKREIRLPTEAEWEYACRAGTETPFYFGENINPDIANYNGNYPYGNGKKGIYRQKTTPVGSFPANAFGLFDMHGNVWEWCEDIYDAKAYRRHSKQNPVISAGGSDRVLRGGGWGNNARALRSAFRGRINPDNRFNFYAGFRLLAKLDP